MSLMQLKDALISNFNQIGDPLNTLTYNHKSMTQALRDLNNDLSIALLQSGIKVMGKHRLYERNVVIKLSNTPVMVATSSTNIINKNFFTILKTSNSTPIGNKLFALNSHIRRGTKMQIRNINIQSIKNHILRNYLLDLDFDTNSPIIERNSYFYLQDETMQLIEYTLPTITKFIY